MRTAFLLAAFAVVAACAQQPQGTSTTTQEPLASASAPDINGVDLDGTAFKLSDYKGKVIMLDFWGDW